LLLVVDNGSIYTKNLVNFLSKQKQSMKYVMLVEHQLEIGLRIPLKDTYSSLIHSFLPEEKKIIV